MTSEPFKETLTACLRVPEGWGDPVDRLNYQTKGTVGIAVEVLLTYGCNEAPKVDKVKITGFNQIGFIISSEYEVEGYVNNSSRKKCERRGCNNAIQYDVEIKFFVYLVVGIGFGFGGGTGTLGYRSPSFQQSSKFTTECICCDEPTPAAGTR